MPANRSSPTVGRRMSKLTKIGYLSYLWLREFISIAKSKNFVCTGTGCQPDDSLSLKVSEDNLNGGLVIDFRISVGGVYHTTTIAGQASSY
jgi:hypothetical protein